MSEHRTTVIRDLGFYRWYCTCRAYSRTSRATAEEAHRFALVHVRRTSKPAA